MKTLVLVLASRESPYPALVEAIRRTWARATVVDVEVLFYFGGDALSVSEWAVYLPVPDDSRRLGDKTIACFEQVLSTHEFDLVFRTNCTTYVDLANLRHYVSTEAAAVGYYAGKGASHDSVDFAVGSGYF